jgi:hypothetical protein
MNTIKLNATLEITPIKFDTNGWKNFSTGYKITCVNYTQEELEYFKKVVEYSQKQGKNSVVVFTITEVLFIVGEFNRYTPTLHTILENSNHPVFSDDFRKEIVG